MKLLKPSSLCIGASWDGNVRHAATICVTVEVESKPNSRLILLDQTKEVGLSHSMVWRINSFGQKVPDVDVKDSKSILAHQIDYPLPSPPMRLFPTSPGYEDRYGIVAKPDSFFMDWLSTNDTKEIPDDHVSISSEPKEEEVEENPMASPDTENPLENPAIDETSATPLSEKNLRQWTGVDRSIEQWFDELHLDLLPSPSPSSQELIPWASTKEIMERLKAEEEKQKENDPLSLSSEVIVAPTPKDPAIVHERGKMVLDFPSVVESKLYRVDIYCMKHVRERRDRWLELELTKIGRACLNLKCRFVLEAPWEFDCGTPDLSDVEIANGRLECNLRSHRLEIITFRRREDRDYIGMSSEDETHRIVTSEPEGYNQSIQNSPQRGSNEVAQPSEEGRFVPLKMLSLNEESKDYLSSGREDGEHHDPASYSNTSDVAQLADELTSLLEVSTPKDEAQTQTLIEQLSFASGSEAFHQRTQDSSPQAMDGILQPASGTTATIQSETHFSNDKGRASIEDTFNGNSPEILDQNTQCCSPRDLDETLQTQSANEIVTQLKVHFPDDEGLRLTEHTPIRPTAGEQNSVEQNAVKPASIERATSEHTSNKNDPKSFKQNVQEKSTQVSDAILQQAYKTLPTQAKQQYHRAKNPRHSTPRPTNPTQAFLHRFLVYFFFAMVVFFSATGGPPEAIATPANTLSTLRSVAGDLRKHGSTMQTVILETFRDAQMRQSLRVSQILWMSQWATRAAEETSVMASVEISTPTSEARCMVTYELATGRVSRTTDMPMQTPGVANISNEGDDDDDDAAIRAPYIAGFSSNVMEESLTAGSTAETGTFVNGKAKVTSITNENDTVTNTGHRGNWAWTKRIGKRILSRVGCSTSAHCIMLAASMDDDPQWEVFERYQCDARNKWQAEMFKDRIDKFLGWRPCEMRD